MAIYHLTAKTVSRGSSVSAAARSDYIERCGRYAGDHAELQDAYKTEGYYQAQIKPYLEYFAEADDKAEAFAFCRERMEADMTIEAPRLKEMSSELSERLRRFGGTGSKQAALAQEAMSCIRVAPDREQAFAAVTGEMDKALERSRGLSR